VKSLNIEVFPRINGSVECNCELKNIDFFNGVCVLCASGMLSERREEANITSIVPFYKRRK